MPVHPDFTEEKFRIELGRTMKRIEDAFAQVDPDVAECEQTMGALTVRLKDGSKVILSGQPSVRQLWLAIASRGMGIHFYFKSDESLWVDDKNKGIELMSFLEQYFKEASGLKLEL